MATREERRAAERRHQKERRRRDQEKAAKRAEREAWLEAEPTPKEKVVLGVVTVALVVAIGVLVFNLIGLFSDATSTVSITGGSANSVTITLSSDWSVTEDEDVEGHYYAYASDFGGSVSIGIEYSLAEFDSADTFVSNLVLAGDTDADDDSLETWYEGEALVERFYYTEEWEDEDSGTTETYAGWCELVFSGDYVTLIIAACPEDEYEEYEDELLGILDSLVVSGDEEPVFGSDDEDDTTEDDE